jgi:hypothetical protein
MRVKLARKQELINCSGQVSLGVKIKSALLRDEKRRHMETVRPRAQYSCDYIFRRHRSMSEMALQSFSNKCLG